MADGDNIKPKPGSRIGQQLYQLLPEIYRGEDNTSPDDLGDLGRYLDAIGEFLDEVRATLDQRLADNFPDNPSEGLACQPWLLPYFAQLLDVQLVSPEVRGQREEVARAVSWRQRKGTPTVAEEIAEAVAQMEVESQEGWRRVALTPRIGAPLLPAGSFGVDAEFDPAYPAQAARHPGLPAATVDLRTPSRAVQTRHDNPAVQTSVFPAATADWRHHQHHGVPCFPDSYQDVSRRTVDLRDCNWKYGHYHPKRLLLYVAPPVGFFPRGWARGEQVVRGDVVVNDGGEHLWEGWTIDGTLRVNAGSVTLRGCAVRELVVDTTTAANVVNVSACDCLFGAVTVRNGITSLEYCTVLGAASLYTVNASDCIFAGALNLGEGTADPRSCIRYSRIPNDFPLARIRLHSEAATTNTRERPVFYRIEYCNPWDDPEAAATVPWVRRRAAFGDPSCGVLHPATPRSILYGAEDGGEMGAYHHFYYALRFSAVIDKIQDFLPVGMKVALVPDSTLYNLPPSITTS